MASAKYETRTKTVTTRTLVLELTEDEASVLRAVIGDSRDSGEDIMAVYHALRNPMEFADAPAKLDPADPYTYKDVVYDKYATYTDNDGDRWAFTGVVRDGNPDMDCPTYVPLCLHHVVDNFGPLELDD